MSCTDEQRQKLDKMQEVLEYRFEDESLLLSAITHPSAAEGKAVSYSYERLEFLGDSLLGAVVAAEAFRRYREIDEGGLTRIKVSLVSGSNLSEIAQELGFADLIVFGSSEAGTGRRGLHSALENVYEAIVAALYLDGGISAAETFIMRTLIPRMSIDMAKMVENPKSALQEKLQEDGITPTYKLVDTQGPPHDRTFVAQVYAGDIGLAKGVGRTKKEAESQAAKSTLARLSEFFGLGLGPEERAQKAVEQAQAKAEKAVAQAQKKVDRATAQQEAKAAKAKEKAAKQAKREAERAQWYAKSLDEGSPSGAPALGQGERVPVLPSRENSGSSEPVPNATNDSASADSGIYELPDSERRD